MQSPSSPNAAALPGLIADSRKSPKAKSKPQGKAENASGPPSKLGWKDPKRSPWWPPSGWRMGETPGGDGWQAMVRMQSRRICVDLYNALIQLKAANGRLTPLKVVMTGSVR